ncbi:ATP-binding protein [Actinomadura flavalba]|uniref:ATP-binding protein n=1 Tax=Actinomadura flavalba TaxID=1120938 RepID=UPI00036EF27E|nr:ATP-binding protein [Actinomadura flavalba]
MITMDKPVRIAPGIFCPYPGGALSTVGRARAAAEEWVRGENYSAEVVGNVALIVTELATNSLRYVAGAAGFAALVYPVELPGAHAGVCVEIWDADAGNPPVLGQPDFVAETGRGLFIVDSLTGGMWGWQCLADDKGKAVWAAIPCT